MKNIQVLKTDRLYRVFNWFAMNSMYSYIHYDDNGNINSFNDVCTFITHCFRILLSSLGYLILSIVFAFIFAIFVGVIILPFIVGLFNLYTQEYSIMTASIVVIPLIIYGCYRHQLYKQFQSEKIESGDSTMVGKIREIVSARSNVFCVKIDVVEENTESKDDK